MRLSFVLELIQTIWAAIRGGSSEQAPQDPGNDIAIVNCTAPGQVLGKLVMTNPTQFAAWVFTALLFVSLMFMCRQYRNRRHPERKIEERLAAHMPRNPDGTFKASFHSFRNTFPVHIEIPNVLPRALQSRGGRVDQAIDSLICGFGSKKGLMFWAACVAYCVYRMIRLYKVQPVPECEQELLEYILNGASDVPKTLVKAELYKQILKILKGHLWDAAVAAIFPSLLAFWYCVSAFCGCRRTVQPTLLERKSTVLRELSRVRTPIAPYGPKPEGRIVQFVRKVSSFANAKPTIAQLPHVIGKPLTREQIEEMCRPDPKLVELRRAWSRARSCADAETEVVPYAPMHFAPAPGPAASAPPAQMMERQPRDS